MAQVAQVVRVALVVWVVLVVQGASVVLVLSVAWVWSGAPAEPVASLGRSPIHREWWLASRMVQWANSDCTRPQGLH